MDAETSGQTTEELSGGRRKGVLACNNCRAGKRRCNGSKPVCSTCARHGQRNTTCSYERVIARKARTSSQIELLQRRIADLEAQRHNGSITPLERPSTFQEHEAGRLSSLSPPVEQSSVHMPVLQDRPVNQATQSLQAYDYGPVTSLQAQMRVPDLETDMDIDGGFNVSGSHIDGLAAVGPEVTNDSLRTASYFGNSSTVNFVGQVLGILSRPVASGRGDPLDSGSNGQIFERRVAEEYAIPPRAEADALLGTFFSKIYPLYPFLDRERFEKTYGDLWKPAAPKIMLSDVYNVGRWTSSNVQDDEQRFSRGDDIPESRRFHLLLNLIFALASHWDYRSLSSPQTQGGELYWKRCKELLQRDFDIFNRPRLQIIQALLYMGIWLQSTTGMTGACSNIIAVAIRMSESLGLHCKDRVVDRSTTPQSVEAPRHCSLRWRIWAGCIMMDHILATTYGRPSMLPPIANIPDIVPPEAGQHPSSERTAMCFLANTLKLHGLVYNHTSHLWGDKGANMRKAAEVQTNSELDRLEVDMDHVSSLLALESGLLAWEKDLPPSLTLAPVEELLLSDLSGQLQPLDRQAIVLRTRYLHSQILAFRPLLLHKIETFGRAKPTSEPHSMRRILATALLDDGPRLCLQAAVELCNLIDLVHRTNNDLLPEPWYVVFYMYTCGMVILAHRHCFGIHKDVDIAFTKCVSILTSYHCSSNTALRCTRVLELGSKTFACRADTVSDTDVSQDGMQRPLSPVTSHESYGNGVNAWDGDVFNAELVAPLGAGLLQNYDQLPDLWMDDQIDWAWLSKAPFEQSSQGMEWWSL
ncbi:hypothetical protein LTR97_007363 [Elasticomyces elasticus]|uniref:Zn(2)-C6 fungal-type domain-containing protein n=1 Tax=Elasticomyces elasticus TaxID=574655 RepID=A0AAN7VQW2_9PEZI|nr:hypothetical protein LTR97_007363 [Elasticomyces elasticus]